MSWIKSFRTCFGFADNRLLLSIPTYHGIPTQNKFKCQNFFSIYILLNHSPLCRGRRRNSKHVNRLYFYSIVSQTCTHVFNYIFRPYLQELYGSTIQRKQLLFFPKKYMLFNLGSGEEGKHYFFLLLDNEILSWFPETRKWSSTLNYTRTTALYTRRQSDGDRKRQAPTTASFPNSCELHIILGMILISCLRSPWVLI